MSKSVAKQVFRGALVIVAVGIVAKLTSFFADALLASFLGTSAAGDAYYMVTNIQYVIFPMLSIGIWKVFLPLYKSHIAQGQTREAQALANSTITFFTLVSLAVVGLLILLAEPVVSVVAPGFRGKTKELCVELVRISAPKYLLITAAAIYASMLQCHNRFLGSQIREVASHIPTILAAIFLYRVWGIRVLAVALVAGGAVRLLIELPFVNWGYRYKPNFHFRGKDFSQVLRKLPSALISEGVTQLNTLVDKAMASTLPEGTISGLNYGQKLMNVFSGLLSTAISTALYPQMIELIALRKRKELSSLVGKILNFFCLLMIPVTLACVLFRQELVSVVFQRGSFGEESVRLTSGIFACYSLGILFIACNTVFNDLFYSHGNTKTPMWVSIANLGINVGLNLLLIHVFGANGLAAATSISAMLSLAIRFILVRKYVEIPWKSLLLTLGKVLAASAIACGIPRLLWYRIPWNRYAALLICAVLGVVLYYCVVTLLRVPELKELRGLLKRKGGRDSREPS